MSKPVEEFNICRFKMIGKLLADYNIIIKGIFNLDTNTYIEGVLDEKSKNYWEQLELQEG